MDVITNLMGGFATCLTLSNIGYAALGAFLGTMVGILPGLGPSATMAIILPITFGMDATPAMIMLTSLYYGAMYGGSTTSILVNVPGEASSVITAIEGHQLALKGKAGTALGLSAIGSFFAGILGTIGLAFTASTLAEFSLKFGPAEMFSLVLMGMFTIIFVGGKDDHEVPDEHGHRPRPRHRRDRHRRGEGPVRLRDIRAPRRHRFRHPRHGDLRHRRGPRIRRGVHEDRPR